jgi:hypothetical protein
VKIVTCLGQCPQIPHPGGRPELSGSLEADTASVGGLTPLPRIRSATLCDGRSGSSSDAPVRRRIPAPSAPPSRLLGFQSGNLFQHIFRSSHPHPIPLRFHPRSDLLIVLFLQRLPEFPQVLTGTVEACTSSAFGHLAPARFQIHPAPSPTTSCSRVRPNPALTASQFNRDPNSTGSPCRPITTLHVTIPRSPVVRTDCSSGKYTPVYHSLHS